MAACRAMDVDCDTAFFELSEDIFPEDIYSEDITEWIISFRRITLKWYKLRVLVQAYCNSSHARVSSCLPHTPGPDRIFLCGDSAYLHCLVSDSL